MHIGRLFLARMIVGLVLGPMHGRSAHAARAHAHSAYTCTAHAPRAHVFSTCSKSPWSQAYASVERVAKAHALELHTNRAHDHGNMPERLTISVRMPITHMSPG